MKPGSLFFFFIISFNICLAQSTRKIDSLYKLYQASTTEKEKADALSKLTDYYYSNKFYKQGDSVLAEQLHIAELSNDNRLILRTYFNNYIANIMAWSTKEDFERTAKFIQQGINFAKSINENDYIAIGYARLASIFRKRGESQKAVENATIALINLQSIKSDSVKAVVYIELGNSYQAKGESVEACKSYNMAFDIAIKSKNPYLESSVYRCLSDLYYKLGDITEAKNILLKSVSLNKKKQQGESLVEDYISLARVTDDTFYVKQALTLINSLHLENYNFKAKFILLNIYIAAEKNSVKAISYLNSQTELKEYFMKGGIANYYYELGEIYRYANNPDSAIHYFEKAEPVMRETLDATHAKEIYWEMAVCYEMKNDGKNAIKYYLKALGYCTGVADLSAISSISGSLSKLYQKIGDFEKSLNFKIRSTITKDSVLQLARNRDIPLLGVERETRKHEEEIRQAEQDRKTKTNIQYIGIFIAICLIFGLVLLIGMFNVSTLLIKVVGYIFFILLFEFIVLFIDLNMLHHFTNGEPLKTWLIKIIIIAALVPIQQTLEHKLIKYLESKKLIRVRAKLSARNKRWWKKKKTVPKPETGVEIDTGVL